MNRWVWVAQYGIAILLAVFLGAVLGNMQLFREATLGPGGWTASELVQFVAYGSALVVFWLLAIRAADEIPEDRNGLAFLRRLLVPVAAVLVVSIGYGVLWLLLGPFLDPTSRTIYNWVFVLGIVATALWLVLTGVQSATEVTGAVTRLGRKGRSSAQKAAASCVSCGARVTAGMKFCGQCGKSLDAVLCRNCGQPLEAGQRFCGACGTRVG